MVRILIVEDESIVAWHIQETLERLSHTVVGIATSGAEAVQIAADAQPELVLMDIYLRGDMDGITAAAAIFQQFDIPIIYLTAYADEATLQRAKASSPYGYLIKPLREQDLRTTIEIALHRHQLERTTRISQQQLALTLISLGDGAIATDLDGAITFINPIAEMLTGWQQEDALGQPINTVLELMHEDTRQPIANPVLEAMQVGGVVRLPERSLLRARDGSERPIGDAAAPIKTAEGDTIGSIMTFQDLSERRQGEAEWWQFQSILLGQIQQMSNQVEVAIACLQVINRASDQIALQTTENSLIRMTLQTLGSHLDADYGWMIFYDDEHQHGNLVQDYISDGFTSTPLPFNADIDLVAYRSFHTRLLQNRCWLNPPANSLPLPYWAILSTDKQIIVCPISVQQRVVGEIGLLINPSWWTDAQAGLIVQTVSYVLTTLRQQQTRFDSVGRSLEQLNQLRDDFLGTIPSRLRAPLVNIQMAVEGLQRMINRSNRTLDHQPSLFSQQIRAYLEQVHEQWQGELSLIDELMAWQNADFVPDLPPQQNLSLQRWLPTIINRFQPQASDRGVSLTCAIYPFLPPLTTHLLVLERVITELLDIALRYAPTGKQITILAMATETDPSLTQLSDSSHLSLTFTITGATLPLQNRERSPQPPYFAPTLSNTNLGLKLGLVEKWLACLTASLRVENQSDAAQIVVLLPC